MVVILFLDLGAGYMGSSVCKIILSRTLTIRIFFICMFYFSTK